MLYGILLSMEKDSRRDLFQTNHSEAVSSLSGRPERNITVMNKTIPEIIHRRVPTTRYEADPSEGLSAEQVAEYRENGWTNRAVEPPSKTTAEIVKSNVCTYFNLIFLIIAIFLILAGSFRDLTFLPVIIANTLIGIVQEIKAKKTLEKLSVLNAPKATPRKISYSMIVLYLPQENRSALMPSCLKVRYRSTNRCLPVNPMRLPSARATS